MALLQITEPGQAVDPHLRKRAIGIDLGTTNSLVAGVRGGVTETLPDADGQHLLPSVVRYHPEGIVVGIEAVESATSDPLNTIFSVKRLLGRGEKDLKTLGKLAPYEFVPHAGGMPLIKTVAGNKSPVEVSSEILKVLNARAEASLAGPVDGVVVTVPAYFDDAQRQATKDSVQIAGLNVLRLLNEPTAAAVAYGLDTGTEGIIAVYDLGGGTFDISLLRLERGVFQVLSTGGDSALGGDDFDRAIAEWILSQRDTQTELDHANQRRLLLECRRIKEQLSEADCVDVDLPYLPWRGVLTRSGFEELIDELVEQTIRACRRALRDAKVQIGDVVNVVMVGGSTRIPRVRQRVEALFEKELLADIDPDRVVAIGAAVQANILIGNKPDSEMLLLDVLPLSLGVETIGGLVEKIVPRNTPIPIAKAQEFTTYKDGQTAMLIHVLQGERELVSECRSLARFELRGIPPMVAGAAHIRVTFQVDADGLLSVTATETSSNVEATVVVKPSYGLSEGEILQMLQASFDHADEDVASRSLAEARVDAERMIESIKSALTENGEELLSQAEIDELEAGVAALSGVVGQDDHRLIQERTERLGHASEEFAALRMNVAIRSALSGRQIDELDEDLR